MIQIESIQIEEFRGIRDLKLAMNRGSFAISGPNGSGKSGVVDAIQFVLTGDVARLRGAGTGDLTLSEHAPHVEKRNDPEAARVVLTVYIPHLKKSASIARTVKKPKYPQITPDDPDIREVFSYMAEHPETTLSRRDIIKFILTEATQRSRDVQTLLKLDDIDQTRATLKTTENKLLNEQATAKAVADSAEDSLKRHLDLAALKPDDLLSVVNKRRKTLGLDATAKLEKDTDLSEGLLETGAKSEVGATKESALADIKALSDAVARGLEAASQAAVKGLLQNLSKLQTDTEMLPLIRRVSFFQAGLNLVDGPNCPLCDLDWDMNKLRAHLKAKLEKSREAQSLRDRLIEGAQTVSAEIVRLRALIAGVARLPEVTKDLGGRLSEWSGGLVAFAESLTSLDGIIAAKERFELGWAAAPGTLSEDIDSVHKTVLARPDKSATAEASSFLVLAQERLNNLRVARRNLEDKKANATRGKSAYRLYCDVSEAALVKLYHEVEEDFAAYYRQINHDDEGEFKAKLEPADGKLGLLVDFHKKGMFPPGAYHSEGHQDGMGVCLYLALMKRVLGAYFTVAVLDDVVMSVDSQHRKQFCKLLKTKFPGTQFIITTHDQVWARQLRTEGVVGAKSEVAFHTWTVETGPVLDEVAEVWDKIDADLAKNEVPTAAARLRRHLEYVASDLADELGAKVHYRADGSYDMGELLGAVIGRQGELLKMAMKAAKSWDDKEQTEKIDALQKARAQILADSNGEQWVINKAIHYNEWADLSRNDFRPVVTVFRKLIELFRCNKPKCDSWLSLTPRNDPVELRCPCGNTHLNLKEK